MGVILSAMNSIQRVLERHGDEIREEWAQEVPEFLAGIFSQVILSNEIRKIQVEWEFRGGGLSPAPAWTSTSSSRSGSPTAKKTTETNPHPEGKITQPPRPAGAFHFSPTLSQRTWRRNQTAVSPGPREAVRQPTFSAWTKRRTPSAMKIPPGQKLPTGGAPVAGVARRPGPNPILNPPE